MEESFVTRKLVYYVAATADGFIAAEDGSFAAFPAEGDHFPALLEQFPETFPAHVRTALGQGPAENRRFDAVVMGRRTYAVGADHGFTNPYPTLRQYVVSRSLGGSPDPAVELVGGDPVALVRRLKGEPGRDIWLCGGGELASQLIGEIDQLILKLNPLVLGRGVPLFGGALPPTNLALADLQRFDSGVLIAAYDVRR